MNIQHKVIVYPLLVMVVAFVIALFGVEYQLKSLWEKQIDTELQITTTSTLTSIASMHDQVMPEEERYVFDQLAREHAIKEGLRLSIINSEGLLVGDSQLKVDELALANDLSNNKEITVAKIKGTAKVIGESELTREPMVFLTQFDNNTGFIVRAGIPLSTYQSLLFTMRKGFISAAVVAIIFVVIFGVFINKLVKQAVAKERSLQDIRIADRTREITLIQTMTTLLNASKSFEESGQIILNIMPRLLPSLSGKLYLLNDNDRLVELVSWGQQHSDNVSVLMNKNINNSTTSYTDNESGAHINESQPFQDSSHLICVDLIDDQELFGVLHFLGQKQTVRDKNVRNVVMQLSEQISLGLTNLRVKNQLRHQAIRDPLTNLYNRRFMLEGFEQALNRAERHNYSLAVLMIDLDHFKNFNDNYGHKIGDLVLTEVAELFRSNLRLEDIACRFGGEEFCIICPDTGLKDAYLLAEKLRVGVSELVLTDEQLSLSSVTISTGIAVYPNHAIKSQQLLIEADKALYSAKKRGRNTTVVCQKAQYGESS
jgi:diguanylate cyclase (GGDEF)-like protein